MGHFPRRKLAASPPPTIPLAAGPPRRVGRRREPTLKPTLPPHALVPIADRARCDKRRRETRERQRATTGGADRGGDDGRRPRAHVHRTTVTYYWRAARRFRAAQDFYIRAEMARFCSSVIFRRRRRVGAAVPPDARAGPALVPPVNATRAASILASPDSNAARSAFKLSIMASMVRDPFHYE